MSKLLFDGDVVIVTGAGGGLGRAHALELAGRGARVVVNDLGGHPFGGGSDSTLAESVVAEIRALGGEAVANTQSVSTPEGGESLTETAIKTWGRVDAIVANAAILRDGPFDEMTVKDFDDVVNVNLRGVFFSLQPAFRAMKAAGGGRILAVSSTSGLLGNANQANYGASKSALLGLTRAIALEGEAHGINANLLMPGAGGTRMHLALVEALKSEANQPGATHADVPFISNPEKFADVTPERVSPLVTVLVHRSCPCTGQILYARAGLFAQPTVSMNEGWATEDPTAENILAHWREITDQSTAVDAGLSSFAHSLRNHERAFGKGTDPERNEG